MIMVRSGLLIKSSADISRENPLVIISDDVTLYCVLCSQWMVLLLAVILEMVSGILAPTSVIKTIYTETLKLYTPSSVVVMILAK